MTYRLATLVLALVLGVQYAPGHYESSDPSRSTFYARPPDTVLVEVLERNLPWLDDVVRARRPMGLRPGVVSDAIPRVVAQCSKAAEEGMTDPQGRGRARAAGRRRGQHAARYTAPLAAYGVLLSSVQ